MTTPEVPSGAEPPALVDRYSSVCGERFDLVRSLPGGRALEIASPNQRFVLKWDTEPGSKSRRGESIEMARRLGREAGWPVPTFELSEDDQFLFVRQSLMPGAELAHLSSSVIEQIVALVDATAGLGTASQGNWPHRLVDTLRAEPLDPQQYVDHRLLLGHSDASRELVVRIQAIGGDLDPGVLGQADDLMHWDLHPGNVLAQDGRITAIIDLDNAAPGQRGFDLITFALSAQLLPAEPGAHQQLLDLARHRVSDDFWVASVAHLVLRFANWGLRTGHIDEAEFWIAEGRRLLRSPADHS